MGFYHIKLIALLKRNYFIPASMSVQDGEVQEYTTVIYLQLTLKKTFKQTKKKKVVSILTFKHFVVVEFFF